MISSELLTVDWDGRDLGTAGEMREKYEQYGAVILRAFLPRGLLETVRSEIQHLITARRRALRLAPIASPTRFDDGIMEIVKTSRADVGPIYDACRRLMAVHRFASSPQLEQVTKVLTGATHLMVHREKQVRLDLPHETKYLFEWHQDFPYTQDSLNAVVYWIPLQDVTTQNGCLQAALGSHRLGLQPARFRSDYLQNSQWSQSRAVEIIDPSVVSQFAQVPLPMQAGDVLVLHTLLLHKSGTNTSPHPRWTMQARHGDFENAWAEENGWPIGIAGEPAARQAGKNNNDYPGGINGSAN